MTRIVFMFQGKFCWLRLTFQVLACYILHQSYTFIFFETKFRNPAVTVKLQEDLASDKNTRRLRLIAAACKQANND